MTSRVTQIVGASKLKQQLKAEMRRHDRALLQGLKKGGLYLQREAQLITPIDVGLLKKSADTRVTKTGPEPEVTVSFSTAYAIFVHEDLYAKHAPGKTAKFLETPAREKADEIAKVVVDEYRRVR